MAIGKTNLEVLADYNPWWLSGKIRPELLGTVKRNHFSAIIAHLETQREILLLEGPRRVGKTTLMYQSINYLLEKGVPPTTIVYASVDDPFFNIETLLADIENYLARHVIKGKLQETNQPLYIFLDEITALPDWELYLKRYYDLAYPFRFICCSSAAALMRRKSRESLAGRIATISVMPFSFSEVLTLRHMPEKLQQVYGRLPSFHLLVQNNLTELYQELDNLWQEEPLIWQQDLALRLYLLEGGFPEYIMAQRPQYKERYFLESVVERVLFHDVGPILGATDLVLLKRLFLYANNQSGSELNITEAGRNLGAPRSTIANYLSHLATSGLLYRLPKYARSVESQMRSLERVYAIDSGLYLSLARISPAQLDQSGGWGRLAELAVFAELKRLGFTNLWYWREREAEVDFVVEVGGSLIAVEVKFRSAPLEPRGLWGLKQFCKRFHPDLRLIISKDTLQMPDPQTLIVPLGMFLH